MSNYITESDLMKESGYSRQALRVLRFGQTRGKYRYKPVFIKGKHWTKIGPAVVYTDAGKVIVMERAGKRKNKGGEEREDFSFIFTGTLEELFKKECPIIGNAEYKSNHKDSLDRLFISVSEYITNTVRRTIQQCEELTNKPRVMRRWTDECKPEKEGRYWVRYGICDTYPALLSARSIELGVIANGVPFTHWLELEPTPILPKEGSFDA